MKDFIVRNKENIIKLAKAGLIVFIFITIFIANFAQLYGPDDYSYTLLNGSGFTLESAVDNAKYIYNNWTGRVIPHVLLGFFRAINPHIFEVINSLVFIVLIVFLNKVTTKKVTFIGIITAFCYLTYAKMFGEKITWIAGALNYLWPTTMMAVLISVMYRYVFGDIKLNKILKILIILFAFITGFMHETVTFVLGMFFICLYLFNFKKIFFENKKETAFYILVFLAFCFGAYLNIFAPGNFARMGVEKPGFSFSTLSNYYDEKWHLLIMIISMIIIGIMKEKEILKRELIIFIIPAIIATIPMMIIGEFPERAFLPFEALFIIVLVTNVNIICKRIDEKQEYLIPIISMLLVLVTYARFAPSTLAQIRYLIPYKYEINEILEENKNTNKFLLVPNFEYYPWMHAEDYINISNFFLDWREDLPINVYTSLYYGLDKIKAINKDEYYVEIYVDTPKDEYNTYVIYDVNDGTRVREMSYYDHIEYPLPIEKLGSYKIDGTRIGLLNKVVKIKLSTIKDGEITDLEIKPEDLIYERTDEYDPWGEVHKEIDEK